MDLHDSVAIVTGASRGIGRAVAAALVGAGAHVHGLARSRDDLDAIAQALGPRFTPHACDVTDADAVTAAIDAAADQHDGRLDVLVANAGLGRFAPVDELSLDDWHVQIDTNLSGLFYSTRAAVPHMKRQQRAREKTGSTSGHIVHVASIAGLVGNPNLSAYNATKFAVRGFAEATMKELRPFGIKTTCLYPGSVETDFSDAPKPTAMQPEDLAETILHVLRLPHRTLISEVVMRPTVVG